MKKQQWILLGITAVFLCLIIGIFVGRNLTGAYIPVNKVISTDTTDTNNTTQPQDGKIDLNTANLQQLQLIPGVGEVIAQRILDYRTDQGGFQAVEELLNVSGIGEKKFEQIKQYVKIADSTENSGS